MNTQPPSRSITLLRRLHLILGTLVSLPVLAWSVSGFLLALPPGSVSGPSYRAVEFSKVEISPRQAQEFLEAKLGGPVPLTALTLEQQGESPRYSVFGQGKSYRINAQTGVVAESPKPSRETRWVRDAHFFNFAGTHRTTLLACFALLTTLSTLSGLFLLFLWVSPRLKGFFFTQK